jgi:hypothetical protein
MDSPVDNAAELGNGDSTFTDDGWSSTFQNLLSDTGKAFIASKLSNKQAAAGAPTAVASPQDTAALAAKAKQKQTYTMVGIVGVVIAVGAILFFLKRR